ncbi:hypothetical protein [Stenotrophomonas phage StenR_269]|nr:hypothetical protein [Stenotrophomonas phage StenR_269]
MSSNIDWAEPCNIDQSNDYPDAKAVERWECGEYDGAHVRHPEGPFVRFTDHEAAISELRSNHERVEGELAAEVERLRKNAARFEWLCQSRRADWSQKIDTAVEKGNAS